jgi:transcription-repair coupling factor (superfamily II helicase)
MGLPLRLLDLALPSTDRPKLRWGQLHGAAASLAVAEAAAARAGCVCAIAESANRADQLAREIAFFAPERVIHRFGDYETLPYDAFSPPQDLIAERLATLFELSQGREQILIVNRCQVAHAASRPASRYAPDA